MLDLDRVMADTVICSTEKILAEMVAVAVNKREAEIRAADH